MHQLEILVHMISSLTSSLRLDRTLNFDVTWVPNGKKDHVVKLLGGMEQLLSSSDCERWDLVVYLRVWTCCTSVKLLGRGFGLSGRQAARRLMCVRCTGTRTPQFLGRKRGATSSSFVPTDSSDSSCSPRSAAAQWGAIGSGASAQQL